MTSDTALPFELEPCPFCGSAAHMTTDTFEHWVECSKVGVCISNGAIKHGGCTFREDAVRLWNTRALSATRTETPTHRHKKRGSEYVLIGMGKVQAENWHSQAPGFAFSVPVPVDMREVAIYRDIKDGSLWARPREEFQDGRFEKITTEGE